MARRVASLLPRWSSRVFSVELDGAPTYFAVREKRREEEAASRVFDGLRDGDRCYSVLVWSGDRVRGARFHGQLKDKLLTRLPPGCRLAPMSSFLPSVKDSLIKGYFLTADSRGSSQTERLLRDFVQRDPLLVCSYLKPEDGQTWTQHLWPGADGAVTSQTYYVVPSEAPRDHPSTLNIVNSDVFYSFAEAYDVLKQVRIVSPCE